ncbi:Nucleotidyl transferase AbiEii toxin, Type IV TA system [Pontibacter indicus]|uniref:Nucleotidyl transferase AbiEii toxin, Type IV TA system n=1 Tax=Pontibacter indicus TaxID=1317125 RepID=A0A1R3XQK0_9BACT|nr:Nucleotidyl transferase AbiEii toxin, Type IV TA system [Pontibacter indicus]
MQIPTVYVEKDYWVTFALFTIFSSEIGKDTVFKGGTALSKCYQMIERFSEDIDLVLLKREGETPAKLKSKLKAVSKAIEVGLPEVAIEGVTRKMGMSRKTAHSYGKSFEGNVGNMMLNSGQPDMAAANGLLPFNLVVLEPVRTICEKIMSLVRFSYSDNPLEDLRKKVRHTYDLHQLLQQKEFAEFLDSSAFDDMLLKVAKDDVASFKNNNLWLNNKPAEAIIFKEIDSVWNELKVVYIGEFKNLVYGSLPDEQAVFITLKKIKDRLASVNWTIKVDPR